jgi:M6 family metalloprotease-like protein
VLLVLCLIELLLTSSDCHVARAQETGTRSHTSNPDGPNNNPSNGEFHALIVLVQFPEHAMRELPSASYFETLCAKKVVPYLFDQSYGRYHIQDCDVLPWTMTNASQTFYANNESNVKGADRAADFASPVLDQWDANPNWDWSKYDADQDGLLDAVMFVHSGWSAEMAEGLECGAAPWYVLCVYCVARFQV